MFMVHRTRIAWSRESLQGVLEGSEAMTADRKKVGNTVDEGLTSASRRFADDDVSKILLNFRMSGRQQSRALVAVGQPVRERVLTMARSPAAKSGGVPPRPPRLRRLPAPRLRRLRPGPPP